ncbi:MAG: SGNH/GDSL hydrolase family protein [Planctomycetota bacterium]
MSETRPRRRVLRLVAVAALGLVVIEGALRLRQYRRHGTADASVLTRVIDDVTGRTIPTPNSSVSGIRIDSRSFRGDELEVPKPEGRVRVAFLGGSTTFCAEASSNATTWPSLVVDALTERISGRSFDQVNAAVPGYMSLHSRERFEARVVELEPDVVVIYHATNDLVHDTREVAEAAGLTVPGVGEPRGLAKWSLTYFLVQKNLQARARIRRAEAANGQLEIDVEALAAKFERRLTDLVESAQREVSVVAVATFAPKVRRSQTPEEQLANCGTSLFYMPYMTVEGLLDGFDAYNDAIRRVAERTGAILVETVGEIPGDAEHYNDSVHFLDPGSRVMASLVAGALADSEPLRELVSASK